MNYIAEVLPEQLDGSIELEAKAAKLSSEFLHQSGHDAIKF